MWRYFLEPRTKKYVEGYGFFSFARKCKKQLLDAGLDSLQTASKKVTHRRGDFLGNKIADEVTKSNNVKFVKLDKKSEKC